MMSWKKILLMSVLAIGLQGCVTAVVGGAAVGVATATAVYHNKGISTFINDDALRQNVIVRLSKVPGVVDQCHIVVSVYNNVVLLVGQAPKEALRQQAVDAVKTMPKVRRLYNEITVEGPTSLLTRSSDAWVTTKVKTQLLATKGIDSGIFKVVTENGTVFLMGRASRKQADMAVNQVRQISGVQKVVKVFEYVRTIITPSVPSGAASGASDAGNAVASVPTVGDTNNTPANVSGTENAASNNSGPALSDSSSSSSESGESGGAAGTI